MQWTVLWHIWYRLMNRLQSVQNAAARLVTDLEQLEHITSVLRQLHWLPVYVNVCSSSWRRWFTVRWQELHPSIYLSDEIIPNTATGARSWLG